MPVPVPVPDGSDVPGGPATLLGHAMACLDENTIAEFFDGALTEAARRDADAHLDVCSRCRSIVSALAAEVGATTRGPDSTGPRPAIDDAEERGRGDAVGRYVVLGHLGAGSMGIVYAAFDPDLDRRVALKILRGQAPAHDRERALREAQSMARLSHPNIVTVHDVGTDRGRIFIAMEHVAGATLRGWLGQQQRSVAEVLGVFADAGRGLAAAHDAGVVHRDFKPDNVLVAEDGRVCVTDFGLAAMHTMVSGPVSDRALSFSGGDAATGIVGTPRYMAPEQAEGLRADARSDQFGFCVALYEALYGHGPFDGDTEADLADAAEAGRIRPAPDDSAVSAAVRRVVVRGLAADPQRRHSSMEQLLERLHTAARPRRRVPLFAAAALVAVVGVGLASAGRDPPCAQVLLDDVWNAERGREVTTAIDATGVPFAAEVGAGVVSRLDDYTRSWTDAHHDACEATHVRRTQTAEVLELRLACLEDRRVELAALVAVLGETDAQTVDGVLDATQRLTPAERCRGVDALGRQARRSAGPTKVQGEQLARIKALADSGDFTRAATLSRTVAADARAADDPATAARGLLGLAWAQCHVEPGKPAEQTLHRALQLAESAGADDLRLRAMTLLVFAVGYSQARYDEGLHWGALARSLADRVGVPPAQDAQLMRYRGLVRHQEGSFAVAEDHHRRALDVLQGAGLSGHPDVAKTLQALADVLLSLRRDEAAEANFRAALRMEEEANGPWHPRVANAAHGLGNVLERQRRLGDARAQYARALEIHEAVYGRQHGDVAGDLLALGHVALAAADLDAAQRNLQEALAIHASSVAGDHPREASILEALARLRGDQGRDAESVELFERALAVQQRARPHHPDVAVFQYNLGTALAALQRSDEAARRLLDASETAAAALGPDHTLVAQALSALGQVRLAAGDPEAAVDPLERALGIWSASADPQRRFEARFALARALATAGREPGRARTLGQLARDEYAASANPDKAELAAVDEWLDTTL